MAIAILEKSLDGTFCGILSIQFYKYFEAVCFWPWYLKKVSGDIADIY